MPTLVLLRHGQSQWNLENRFTGWVDVDLTAQGEDEARAAGRLMAAQRLAFDVVFTSVLKRAVRTVDLCLAEMEQSWLPVHKHWRLNERHYGALQGLDKSETVQRHGEAQVKLWRRSYAVAPPPMPADDSGHPARDPRYAQLDARVLPATESLKTTLERVLPYWHDAIAPALKRGRRVLVVAHGNSLRALYKYLNDVADDEIVELNIPTGIPLRFELDDALRVQRFGYLGDAEVAARAAAAVARQATGQRQ